MIGHVNLLVYPVLLRFPIPARPEHSTSTLPQFKHALGERGLCYVRTCFDCVVYSFEDWEPDMCFFYEKT